MQSSNVDPFDLRTRTSIVFVVAVLLAAVGCGSAVDTGGNYSGGPAQGGPTGDYQSGENYEKTEVSPWHSTDKKATSTFSIDVDTGSYTLMRRDIKNDKLPQPAGVRAEEYINYFQYDYPKPGKKHPFSIATEVGPSEFGPKGSKLLQIGLKGREISNEELDPINLVFLIDVSGSMTSAKKLPMVKRSLRTLLGELRPSDTVGIVVYAGSDGVVLEPTPASEKEKIESAIDSLESGGSTNGEAGIVRAYEMAEQAKKEGGINRVMLATDGDFNVGRTGDDLVDLVADYREKHISLTTLGYGRGNYNDSVMEKLARDGNGNYFYIDSEKEAERIFGPELASTLEVIASDVKIQVEFDDGTLERYRLVGYDNRQLDNEDFANDAKDAGEIGPGHTVTAYYELDPAKKLPTDTKIAEVRLRYKDEYGEKSKKIVRDVSTVDIASSLKATSDDYKFGAAVAEYAEILRESPHSEGARFEDVAQMAESATQKRDRRENFVDLVERAAGLWSEK